MELFRSSPTPFEEALNYAGDGRYNVLLAITCAFILLSISIDMFGFSLVISAACDLNIDMKTKTLILSLPFFGIFLTSYFWGYIADTCGRRFTLLWSMNIGFLLSISCSFSVNWIMLGVIKFFAVCFYSAGNSSAFTLVGESCVARKRSRYTLLMSALLILSPAVSSGISYPALYHRFSVPFMGLVLRPWRLLNAVLALPLGVGGVLIYFFYESPKFLANWDRQDEALQVIKRIYEINSRGRKGPFTLQSMVLEDQRVHKPMTFCQKIIAQGIPLFKKPLLKRTLQLFYIIAVIYLVNNSVIIWMPQMMTKFETVMQCKDCPRGSICNMMTVKVEIENKPRAAIKAVCEEKIENITIIALLLSQSTFSILNSICSIFPHRRRLMLMIMFGVSAFAALLVPLVTNPYVSIVCMVIVSVTCIGMGILASYFIDLYPTSYRGMVQCLSIMVARSSSFCGVYIFGLTIFSKCWLIFTILIVLVLSAMVATWFLPKDKPIQQ